MDEVHTGAPEKRNAPIWRIQTTLQDMGVAPYTNLLAYQTAVINHEAQTKWELGVDRLPEDVELAGRYFSTFSCVCCDEVPVDQDEEVEPTGESSERLSGTGSDDSEISSDDTGAASVAASTAHGDESVGSTASAMSEGLSHYVSSGSSSSGSALSDDDDEMMGSESESLSQ